MHSPLLSAVSPLSASTMPIASSSSSSSNANLSSGNTSSSSSSGSSSRSSSNGASVTTAASTNGGCVVAFKGGRAAPSPPPSLPHPPVLPPSFLPLPPASSHQHPFYPYQAQSSPPGGASSVGGPYSCSASPAAQRSLQVAMAAMAAAVAAHLQPSSSSFDSSTPLPSHPPPPTTRPLRAAYKRLHTAPLPANAGRRVASAHLQQHHRHAHQLHSGGDATTDYFTSAVPIVLSAARSVLPAGPPILQTCSSFPNRQPSSGALPSSFRSSLSFGDHSGNFQHCGGTASISAEVQPHQRQVAESDDREDDDGGEFFEEEEEEDTSSTPSAGGGTCGSCWGSRSSGRKTPRHYQLTNKHRIPISFLPSTTSTFPTSPTSLPRLNRTKTCSRTAPNTPTAAYYYNGTPTTSCRHYPQSHSVSSRRPLHRSCFGLANSPPSNSHLSRSCAAAAACTPTGSTTTTRNPSFVSSSVYVDSAKPTKPLVLPLPYSASPPPPPAAPELPAHIAGRHNARGAPSLGCCSYPLHPSSDVLMHVNRSSTNGALTSLPTPAAAVAASSGASSSSSSSPFSTAIAPATALPAALLPTAEPTFSNGVVVEPSCSSATPDGAPPYDLQFGGVQIKLHKKLSAKCHCQFDVWEAEATAYVDYQATATHCRPFPLDTAFQSTMVDSVELVEVHRRQLQLGSRFALKLLDVDACEPAKLKYKTHSVVAEGRQLSDLCGQMWDAENQLYVFGEDANAQHKIAASGTAASGRCNVGRPYRTPPNLMPIPRYLWTADGCRKDDGQRVLGVAMEAIQGRSLTHLLQQLRCPTKPSAALLALEISIKIVESQRVLAEKLRRPLINWDTKPGNIILELSRSSSGRLHCRRAVIVDLGDALAGPSYWFPTRHRPGETPGYIICTKGYCSPECALLVFLLASSSRCAAFRRVWYGDKATLEQLQEARRQRVPHRWRQWVKQGFLRRSYSSTSTGGGSSIHNTATNSAASTSIPGSSSSSHNTTSPHTLPAGRSATACDTPGCSTPHNGASPLPSQAFAASNTSTTVNQNPCDSSRPNSTAAPTAPAGGPRPVLHAPLEGTPFMSPNPKATNSTPSTTHTPPAGSHPSVANSSGSAPSTKDRGCWEILFTEKSVVFSTGLVLAQLFGGPNLLQVVEKDEVRALDLLCEWGQKDTTNLYGGQPNLCPADLLPSAGVFAEERWQSRLLALLEGCLAFLPMDRWSFKQVEEYLHEFYHDYYTAYSSAKLKTGSTSCSTASGSMTTMTTV